MVRIKSKPKAKKRETSGSSISPADDKRGKLLIQMDEMMENIGNTYGPIVLDELERRVEKTISDFNTDVNEIMETTFDNHKTNIEKAQEYTKQGVVVESEPEQPKEKTDKNDENNIPKYISEYEENQKKKKKKK